MYEPTIKVKYKVTIDTRVITIAVEHGKYRIQWDCNTTIHMDTVEPDTIREVMSIQSGIYGVKIFLFRRAWTLIKRSRVKSKGRNPIPVKWVFKSMEEPDGLIRLN